MGFFDDLKNAIGSFDKNNPVMYDPRNKVYVRTSYPADAPVYPAPPPEWTTVTREETTWRERIVARRHPVPPDWGWQ
jgi:hypothetical protein